MLLLVHHGDAVGPEIDTQRPLSSRGAQAADLLAREAAARGVRPVALWHSGKLRARQTAEAFWRACNPLATLTAVPGMLPGDPPERVADRVAGEPGDLVLAGHLPHLDGLFRLLTTGDAAGEASLPPHGVVALALEPGASRWREVWRLAEPPVADPLPPVG